MSSSTRLVAERAEPRHGERAEVAPRGADTHHEQVPVALGETLRESIDEPVHVGRILIEAAERRGQPDHLVAEHRRGLRRDLTRSARAELELPCRCRVGPVGRARNHGEIGGEPLQLVTMRHEQATRRAARAPAVERPVEGAGGAPRGAAQGPAARGEKRRRAVR